jgi:hypothetical protein
MPPIGSSVIMRGEYPGEFASTVGCVIAHDPEAGWVEIRWSPGPRGTDWLEPDDLEAVSTEVTG